jgi:hypothetical protein
MKTQKKALVIRHPSFLRASGVSLSNLGFVGLAAVMAGCLGAQQQSTLDNMGAAVAGGKSQAVPVVEAYFEFAAPHEKWAGPAALNLHLVAREGDFAKLKWTSRTLQAELAALPGQVQNPDPNFRVPLGVAREALAQLEKGISEGNEPFFGCTSPVSLKLIKANGAIVEKQGCRSDRGWPKLASQLTSDWLKITAQGSAVPHRMTQLPPGAPNDPTAKSPGAAFQSGAHPVPAAGGAPVAAHPPKPASTGMEAPKRVPASGAHH